MKIAVWQCGAAPNLCYFCTVKIFLAILGCAALALGVVGIFVPLLPTTPFLLLAAALWVRSSPRLYEWLLAHRCFGEYIRNFRENRAIPMRAKVVSIALMWGTMLYCIFGRRPACWPWPSGSRGTSFRSQPCGSDSQGYSGISSEAFSSLEISSVW